jgi:KaiC/GvpD/RAD55 family RecA-like ATPase
MTEDCEHRVRSLSELLDEDFPEREDLLAPWLTAKHLSMIYAPTGVGKSWFALAVALAVAGGGELMDWSAPAPRRVLLVDGEMDAEDLQQRARELLQDRSAEERREAGDNLRIFARQDQRPGAAFPDLGEERGRDDLLALAEAFEPALVVLDNFSTLATVENENDASSFDPIVDLMQEMKRSRRASILVHHARKNSKGVGSYRGTSKMGVIFNSIISLNHPNGVPSSGGAAFDLQFEKYRGMHCAATDSRRVWLEQSAWRWESQGLDELGELVQLVRSLDFGSQKQLAERLGVSPGEVSKRKKRAVQGGLITAQDWGECLGQAIAMGETHGGADF